MRQRLVLPLQLFALLLCLALAAPAFAAAPAAILSFDECSGTVAHDSSGAGNDGNIYGAAWTSEGHSGCALQFDGVDDYVEMTDIGLPAQMGVEA